MRIRTQLILAFLLLSVLPLTGIVLYSYYSSLQALRRATEGEARSLAGEMDGRMASLRQDLGRGVSGLGDVPVNALIAAARSSRQGKADPLIGKMVLGLGEAAPLVQSLEVVPAQTPAAAAAPETPETPAPAAAPEAAEPSPIAPPAPGAPPHQVAVVIDVDQILKQAREVAAVHRPEDLARIEDIAQAIKEKSERAGRLEIPIPPPIPMPQPAPLEEEIERRVQERITAEAERRERLSEAPAPEAPDQPQTPAQGETAAKAPQPPSSVLRGSIEVPLWDRGQVVGRVKASLRGPEVLRHVLERTRVGEGEIPFAVDAEGNLHTVGSADRKRLEKLPISLAQAVHQTTGSARWILDEWVVATSKDPESGAVFGIARPVPLEEVRRAAARNFGYGLGMIGLALLGILPLTNRMTRGLKLVTDGADRIAQGDLETRIPIRSRNELGALAQTFNRMAEDLKQHQEREIEAAVLRTEYDRKSRELEEAREFQLSLLPKTLPEHPGYQIAVSMRTATEVGGDYYDFHLGDDGVLTAAVGDATGHGVRAGTMVTAVKSLFSADAGASSPRQFLAEAARAVKRMALDRMAMGLTLARLDNGTLTLSAAGMPPVLVYRAQTGKAEEVALVGMPLGGLAYDYDERRLPLNPGDTVLLMTDGLPELTDPAGEPLGYPRVRSLFEEVGALAPEEVIAELTRAADAWAAGGAVKDDITFVVVRVRG